MHDTQNMLVLAIFAVSLILDFQPLQLHLSEVRKCIWFTVAAKAYFLEGPIRVSVSDYFGLGRED